MVREKVPPIACVVPVCMDETETLEYPPMTLSSGNGPIASRNVIIHCFLPNMSVFTDAVTVPIASTVAIIVLMSVGDEVWYSRPDGTALAAVPRLSLKGTVSSKWKNFIRWTDIVPPWDLVRLYP